LGVSARAAAAAQAGRALRIGFVGLGWIGRTRLDAVSAAEDVEIAALADSDPTKLDLAHALHPQAHAARDLESMLACDLDGIVIATPSGLHAEQAIACLSHGVPVFCQKPLAVNAEAAQAVIDVAAGVNRLLGVDFCYRHVRGMAELRRRIADGALGEILAIDLTFHNAYGPDKAWAFNRGLSGGGALLDLGVHLLDLALWLQSAASMRVSSSRLFAQGRALTARAEDIEDMAYAELRQSNGAIVRLACSWHAHTGRDAVIAVEVFGSRGGVAWRNVNGSFYDFTLDVFQGRTRERIGAPPDEWGPRALSAWLARLRVDSGFDEDARLFVSSARLIDEIYAG
jgi:predicted dehydrogenase